MVARESIDIDIAFPIRKNAELKTFWPVRDGLRRRWTERPAACAPDARGVHALAIAATGRNAAEIAEYLGTSPDMIRRALVSATNKLGARSKLEALIIALRHGLIELPDD
jgi:DNA-binding CsgD family transcriptional regulator